MRSLFSVLLQGYLVASFAIGLDRAPMAYAASDPGMPDLIEVQIGDSVQKYKVPDLERNPIEIAALGNLLVGTDGRVLVAFNPQSGSAEVCEAGQVMRFEVRAEVQGGSLTRKIVLHDPSGRLAERYRQGSDDAMNPKWLLILIRIATAAVKITIRVAVKSPTAVGAATSAAASASKGSG